ncbi:MAG: two-component regulator propeller domain-containing protein, partial [Bacteroidota bacterium]
GGVSRFDGKVFVNTNQEQGLANNWVLSILEDKKGNIWFGHDGAGASCYNGENYTYYTKDQGLAGSIIRCIAEDTKGNIWFGTDGGGVSRYDGESFANFNIENGLGNDAVFSIIEDKAGNLWFSTFGGGVSCYQGKSFTTFSTANGLSSGQVMCIAEDNAGSLWFGTYGGGASKYDGKSFTNYTPAQGLDNHLLCIEADKTGKLWFGSFKGFLTCYDGKSFTNYRSEQGLVSNTINSITVDQSNNIWLGTPRGLTRFNGESFTNYTAAQGLVNNSVHCVFADKKDRIWALTDKGISRSDSLLSADSLEVKFTNFTTANGLPGNVVYNMTEDKKGNFWLAGTAGLSRYDGQSFLNYSSSDGLMQDAITQVIQDKTGGIWVGTRANFGLGQLSFQKPAPLSRSGATKGELIPAGLLSTSNKELKNYDLVTDIYNAYTGYPLKAVSALFMDSKGIIWMATSSDKTALIRFDPSAINKNSNPRTVVIKSVKINEEKIGWYSLSQKNNKNQTDHSLAIINEEVTTFGKVLSDIERDKIYQKYTDIQYDSVSKWYPTPQNLVLPFDHNNITFDFVAIEPARNFLVRYQYMLEGYDKSWSPVTDKTSASFGNMHEGIYTFKLKAKSSFGIWGEPITYTFEVLPPWWRTWWMYVFYILAVISTVVLIVRWNSRKLIAQRNRLKEKITRATTQIRQEKIKIEEANIHITEQKKVVEEKNKDILDSIHYAKRIQNALLRKEEYFVKHLPEHFVLFMPKDIVSGDFYWALRRGFSLPTEEEASKKYWYVAAVDCTGHGVPGAFMSMLGMSFLNEIANGDILHTPAKILNELRTKVIKELGQTGKMENSKDGMDISLIRWHLETNEIQWAGANNPLFLVRNGELQKIKGDKQPIGYYPESKPFTNHTLQLQEGDCIYIFTDGYADQFGGPKGKKLMYKQLEQLILTNCHLSMDNQKRILKKTFMEWKGELDQIDDVCIIGIKI